MTYEAVYIVSHDVTSSEGNFAEKILSGMDWEKLYINPENKKDLFKLVRSCFQTDICKKSFVIPLILNSNENI